MGRGRVSDVKRGREKAGGKGKGTHTSTLSGQIPQYSSQSSFPSLRASGSLSPASRRTTFSTSSALTSLPQFLAMVAIPLPTARRRLTLASPTEEAIILTRLAGGHVSRIR